MKQRKISYESPEVKMLDYSGEFYADVLTNSPPLSAEGFLSDGYNDSIWE